ncbi:MAG: prepilin peptidase [Firmicutes bacterium]|nr:prepilin peptidase [Bacillota bacterium]HXL03750.1 prepilin peptidase [Bacillota bacterium]
MLKLTGFIIGTVVGSFLGVCIHRIPRGESLIMPRSYCPKCRAELRPAELIPIIGYILIWGRCRHCGERVSPWHPLLEAGCGLLFAKILSAQGFTVSAINSLVLISLAVVAAGIDFRHKIIPDIMTLPWMVVGLVIGLFSGGIQGVFSRVLGLAACGGLVFLIAIVSRGGMGGGDIKLMALVGSFLGVLGGLTSFIIACIIGAIVGVILIALGIKSRRDEIPFGPFISLGTIITCIFSEQVIPVIFPWLRF